MSSNNEKTGLLFIISAPSGAGKTSLVSAVDRAEKNINISVSHTTRPKRDGEINGVDYHFVDDDTFNKMKEEGRFLEHAQVFDYQYGTSKDWVEEQLSSGQHVILEIDWQGAEQVKKLMPESVTIFVLPPSFQTLEERLVGRGNDSDEIIKQRMEGALDELSHFENYQYITINDDFQKSLSDIRAIIQCSRHNMDHQANFYQAFVKELMEQAK